MNNRSSMSYLRDSMSWKLFQSICVALFFVGACSCTSTTENVEHSEHRRESNHDDTDHHSEEAGALQLNPTAIEQAGIKTEPVQAATVQETIAATGVVAADESHLGHIRPLSRGIVRQVFVQRGDRVGRDQPLVSYDNIEVGDLMGSYQGRHAELRRARADRAVKQKLWERGKELYAHQAISQKELELREAEFLQAEETVRRWEAAIDETKVKLRRFGLDPDRLQTPDGTSEPTLLEDSTLTLLRAPFNGVVIDYDVSPGEVVAPERLLLTIADLSTVWVLADVYERDLAAISGAQTAVVELEAYPGRRFEGKITYIGDVLDRETRTVKIRCVVPNPDHLLKLGMFATVQIPSQERRTLPVVPLAAVQTIDGGPVVFVQTGEGRFERRRVRTGREEHGQVAVEQGLEAGEMVVTHGSFSLKSELLREQLGGGHAH